MFALILSLVALNISPSYAGDQMSSSFEPDSSGAGGYLVELQNRGTDTVEITEADL